MPKNTTSKIEPSDVLGAAMFVVGVAILIDGLPPMDSTDVGITVMILGIGAVFGRETFVELVKELVLSKDKKDGVSESDDETSGSEGDDESDDGEVGIDRPPGEEVKAEA